VEPARATGTTAVLAAALVVVGCGDGTKVDHKQAEAFIGAHVRGPRPAAIDCPKGVTVKPGRTFSCALTYSDGTTAAVTVHILNDKGQLAVSASDFKARGG
jgi:hypothetical protein